MATGSNTFVSSITASSNSSDFQCIPQSSVWALGWFFIPCLEVILNSFLMFVTYRSKEKLRHNYVYAYVISVFAGNFFLSLFTVYSILNYVLVFERYWGSDFPFKVDHLSSTHEELQLWWAFRRAFMVSLYLINNANVSALIYGIRDSAYFVGRNAAYGVRRKDNESLSKRRNKTAIIITLTWLVPLGFTIAGLFANCIDHCICVYANYGENINYCQSDKFSQCSRIWQPLTDQYLLSLALTWCVEVLVIIFMLISAIKQSMLVMQPNKERKKSTSILSFLRSLLRSNSYERTDKPKQSLSAYFKNSTVKLLTAISVTFFITSVPLMVVIFIDVISEEYVLLRYSVTAVLAISLLYGLVVPFILVFYMPSLRSATIAWFHSFKCCMKSTEKASSVVTVSRN